MSNKSSVFTILILLGLLLSSNGAYAFGITSPAAVPLNSPIGTGFTYQGYLTDGGSPTNGAYDLQFKLFNDASVGTQVGSTVTKGDVVVSEGIFTVGLDFGDVFDGTAYWLEIWVRPGASTGGYQQLLPRQPLTTVPYASYATNAPWSGLSGVPAGFADDVDNNTTYAAGNQLSLAGTTFNVSEGASSGLDADLLDGQQGSFYRNASNINAGTVNNARFSGYSDLSAEGYLNNNSSSDLLTRSQADGRYWNASNINSGTLSNAHFSAFSDWVEEGHLGTHIHLIPSFCPSGGTLTLDISCMTLLCSISPTRYFNCAGACTNTVSQQCPTDWLGRLIDT